MNFGGVQSFYRPMENSFGLNIKCLFSEEVSGLFFDLMAASKRNANSEYHKLLQSSPSDDSKSSVFLEIAVHPLNLDRLDYFQIKIQRRTENLSKKSDSHAEQDILLKNNREIKKALLQKSRELESTKDSLRLTVNQLETSNEELQASNTELLAGSRELQTTNEELQAVNEELHSVNSELQLRINEMNLALAELNDIYQISDVSLIYLDQNMRLKKFNENTAKLFKLSEADENKELGTLRQQILVGLKTQVESTLKNSTEQRKSLQIHGTEYWVRIKKLDQSCQFGCMVAFLEPQKWNPQHWIPGTTPKIPFTDKSTKSCPIML